MSTHVFTAQDASGRRCRIQVVREEAHAATSQAQPVPSSAYVLEDGSRVRRIDNDTFLVIGTGAYVTRVSD
ncbi:hypothetical protein [Pseudoxanthomonas sp. Root630]|uniref:hypothetical protein n=1 Tax=Pseudoxanthomonas sp. Root630 TaxID=1736574 RepID=UPI0007025DAE|nr:hypothetical protein [Pseudoxanthomonas sp. Root630]KRA40111.1 hypothetical protein ASD72_16930 [Pseudoxanthomonas sp. Root630]